MGGRPGHRFSYRGRVQVARPGETLFVTLARGGLPILQRSIRYHRPRAPFCGIGQCTGCLVRVNGRPNVRACRYLPAEGDVVETENAWPSPRFDVLGVLDLLFPRGIDTLRGFRWPAFAAPFYHRVVRRLSGYGSVPTAAAAASFSTPPDSRAADVVVVGAGEVGRHAAARLVADGRRPLLIDRNFEVAGVAGADVLPGTTVTFLPPPAAAGDHPFTLLGFGEPAHGVAVRARAVLVATGAYDACLLFGGNDRPGVLTADGAFALSAPDQPPLFRKAVVVGGGERAREVLERLGTQVSAVVAPGEIRPEVVREASDLGIPLYPRSLVLRTSGRARVRALHLKARGRGPTYSLPCDGVVLAHRRLPNGQLFFQAGARMEWRAGAGAYYPSVAPDGATSVPGLYGMGAAAGIVPSAATEAAERTADAVAGKAPTSSAPLARVPDTGPSEFEGYYRELLREPRRGRWTACACEDVQLGEVEAATRAGYRGIEVVKRYSNLGTGLCQGRYCLPDALLLLSLLEGRPPAEVGYITQRPPVLPTPLEALAGLDGSFPPEGRA